MVIFFPFASFPDHKGYRCFDLTSRRVLISRHVFDESDFPYSTSSTPSSDSELESLFSPDLVVQPPLSVYPFPVGFPGTPAPPPVISAAPHAAPVPSVAPHAAPVPSVAPCAAPVSPAAPRVAPVPPLHLHGTVSRCRCTGVVRCRHRRRLRLRRLQRRLPRSPSPPPPTPPPPSTRSRVEPAARGGGFSLFGRWLWCRH